MHPPNAVKKKILIAYDLNDLFRGKNGLFRRADILMMTADSNNEILALHREEKADLIVTLLDLPGLSTEELIGIVRDSRELKKVSTIIVCRDTLDQRERSKASGTNAFFTLPVDAAMLHLKVQQFLRIAPRKSFRAALAVAIQGRFKNKPLPFWTDNISGSGMLIRSEEPLAKGDGIFFSFYLPDGAHVSGYGDIARVVQPMRGSAVFQYGIRFTNLDPAGKAAIEASVGEG